MTGVDTVTSLKEITGEMIDAIAKTRTILDSKVERRTYEGFMAGYLAYHRFSSRYRLEEVWKSAD